MKLIFKIMFVALAMGSSNILFSRQEVNITENKYNIDTKLKCYYSLESKPALPGELVTTVMESKIVCENPETGQIERTFHNVNEKTMAALGTPGWILFENYIGKIQLSSSVRPGGPKRIGGDKQRIFCEGPCHKK